jgi:DNA-binding CsgD family transcriptional regulator/tetratricopeptide (TPR) repeat protein
VTALRRTPLIGRTDELGQLTDALDSARDGRPVAALISGEAGIGKTRLVTEAATTLREGDVVLTGNAVELSGGGLPFGVLRSTMRGLSLRYSQEQIATWADASFPALSPLLPGMTATDVDPLRVIDAFASLLTQIAADQLTWWQVEDLHWADAESRDALRYVVQLMQPPSRLLVTATLRTHDRPAPPPLAHMLAELTRAPASQRIELHRLTSTQVSEQLTALRGDTADPALLDRVMALSQGIPFLTEELMAGGLTDVGPLPASAAELMLTRLQRLEPDTQRVVQAASLAETDLDESALARVTELESVRLEASLHEAVDASVFVFDGMGTTYQFHHALLQQAVAQAMLPSERVRWHDRWARTLSESASRHRPDLAAQVAEVHHWASAGELDLAFERALTAASIAENLGAQRERAAMLCRALTWWPEVTEACHRLKDHDDLVEDALWACSLGGAVELGIATCERELSRLDDSGIDPGARETADLRRLRLTLARRRFQEYDSTGTADMTRGDFFDDVAVLARSPRSLVFLRVLSDLVSEADDDETGRAIEPLLAEGMALLTQSTPTFDRLDLLDSHIHHLKVLGRTEEAADAMEALLEEAGEDVHLTDLARFESNAVSHLFDAGRFVEAAEIGRRALGRLPDPRLAPRVWEHVASNLAAVLFELGEWDEVASLLGRIEASAGLGLESVWTRLDHAVLLIRRGNLAAARHELSRVSDVHHEAHSKTLDFAVRLTEAELAFASGAAQQAWELVDPEAMGRSVHLPNLARDRLLLAALTISRDEPRGHRAGHPDTDRRAASVRAAVEQLPHIGRLDQIWRAHVEGELTRAEGRDTSAMWKDVVQGRRELGQQYWLGWTLVRRAECLLSENADAEAELVEALTLAEHLGATPLASAARRLAQRGRVSVVATQTGRRRGVDHALTEREREVLDLLVEGFSNDEVARTLFIAPKTASVHVSRILAKLGVKSRGEAAALARREGISSGDPGRN